MHKTQKTIWRDVMSVAVDAFKTENTKFVPELAGHFQKSIMAKDGLPVPEQMILTLSSAADRAGVERILNTEIVEGSRRIPNPVKRAADPLGYVVKREESTFGPHLDGEFFALLKSSHAGEDYVRALTAVYKIAHENYKPFGEVGTTLTVLPPEVKGSGSLVVAAASINFLMKTQGEIPAVTEIKPDNTGSLIVYGRKSGFRPVKDPTQINIMHKSCNATIAPVNKGNVTEWLEGVKESYATMAAIMVSAAKEGLKSPHGMPSIAVDISPALERIGMNFTELVCMAGGKFPERQGRIIEPPPLQLVA
jgi:hypothetical protein